MQIPIRRVSRRQVHDADLRDIGKEEILRTAVTRARWLEQTSRITPRTKFGAVPPRLPFGMPPTKGERTRVHARACVYGSQLPKQCRASRPLGTRGTWLAGCSAVQLAHNRTLSVQRPAFLRNNTDVCSVPREYDWVVHQPRSLGTRRGIPPLPKPRPDVKDGQ